MPLAPGTTLGPYVIVDQVGAGGMGEVYRAHDERLDRDVAIKILPEHIADEPHSRTRFEREARALAGLSHPNILSIFDVGTAGSIAYVVTELLQGRTLRNVISEGAMPWQEAVLTALQIVEGLSAAHSRGIVHRDLKPENIFITSDNRLKILDFGLARSVSTATPEAETGSITPSTTVPGSVVGTLGYMSPEQVRGEPVDGRSDQFSLGCVLYEMITGRRPFIKATVAETMAAILRDEPPGLRAMGLLIPEELEQIIATCLKKNPDYRYPSTTKLLDVLRSIATAGFANVIVRPLPIEKRAFPWKHLRLPAAAVMIAILVFVSLRLFPRGRVAEQNVKPAEPRHVAVLPFRNIGDDPANKAFCDGLLEIVTSKITGMEPMQKTLWVVPASEVIGQGVTSASDAKRRFGANLVIAGSVQREGEVMQVTLNLIDASSSRQIQSEVIRLTATSLARFEEDAADRLLTMLQIEMDPKARRTLSDGGTSSSEAYSLYVQGVGLLERYDSVEKQQKAIDLFQQAVILDPRYALAYKGLGEGYWQLYLISRQPVFATQAKEYCEKARKMAPENPEVLIALGETYRGTGRTKEAIDLFQRAIAKNPYLSEARARLARAYEYEARLKDAENEFKKALEIRPDYWGTYNELGAFYFFHGRYVEAEKMFQMVLRLTPDNVMGLNNLSGVYLQTGKTDRAESLIRQILKIHPLPEAYSNLGTILYSRTEYTGAAQMYRAAIELQSNDPALWGNLGDALRYSGATQQEWEEAYLHAVGLQQERLKVTPADSYLRASLGLNLARVHECERALSEIRTAYSADPSNPIISYKAMMSYDLCGNRQEAVRKLESAIKAGYPTEQLIADPDLQNLRKDPAAKALLASGH
jgi:serine/threonine-protein kinase